MARPETAPITARAKFTNEQNNRRFLRASVNHALDKKETSTRSAHTFLPLFVPLRAYEHAQTQTFLSDDTARAFRPITHQDETNLLHDYRSLAHTA